MVGKKVYNSDGKVIFCSERKRKKNKSFNIFMINFHKLIFLRKAQRAKKNPIKNQ